MDLYKNLTGPRFGPWNRLKGHSLGRAEGVHPPGHHGLVWDIVARGHQVASLRGILRIALQRRSWIPVGDEFGVKPSALFNQLKRASVID